MYLYRKWELGLEERRCVAHVENKWMISEDHTLVVGSSGLSFTLIRY